MAAGTCGSGQIGRQVGKRQPVMCSLAVCRSSLCVSLFHCELLKCKAGPENVTLKVLLWLLIIR